MRFIHFFRANILEREKQAVAHVMENPEKFKITLACLMDTSQFHSNIHYMLLYHLPNVDGGEVFQQYQKYGPVAHVITKFRVRPRPLETRCYAYVGYHHVSSLVTAMHQGKRFFGMDTCPRPAHWSATLTLE